VKDKIVVTSNVYNGLSVITALSNLMFSRLGLLGVIFGRWGLGKSTFLEWTYANIDCFYVRALTIWRGSPNAMVEDMLKAMRVAPRGRLKSDFPELVSALKKQGKPLLIDESDLVVARQNLIGVVRDLHDLARVPIVLIGSENLLSALQRHDLGPVQSRVSQFYEFTELTADDVQLVAKELCELTCNPKVADLIRSVTQGNFRLLNVLLSKLEEMASLNRVSEISQAMVKAAATGMDFRGERLAKMKNVPMDTKHATALQVAG
jgi:hypothetical protein